MTVPLLSERISIGVGQLPSTAREITRAKGGDWFGGYGLIPGPNHSKRDRSVKICDGPNGLCVHSFAGEDWKTIKDVLRAEGFIGAGKDLAVETNNIDLDARGKREAAIRIWDRDTRSAAGTAVEADLRGRGLTGPIPKTLRYAPALKYRGTELFFPAMVAAVQDVDGRLTGIHRTFVKPDGSGKAVVSQPKMMLGPCKGGAVRLGPVADRLIIAEGIESAWSVKLSTRLPAWAALSASGLKTMRLPSSVREVIVGADGDETGIAAAEYAARRFRNEGRYVKILQAPNGRDFNDELLK